MNTMYLKHNSFTCNSTIYRNGSLGILACDKVVKETTTLPPPPDKPLYRDERNYILVWNKTIEVEFSIPRDVIQGVYLDPEGGSKLYYDGKLVDWKKMYFPRVSPRLPICVRINGSIPRYFLHVVVRTKIWINNIYFDKELSEGFC